MADIIEPLAGIPSRVALGSASLVAGTYAQNYAAMQAGAMIALQFNRPDMGDVAFRVDINQAFVDISAIIQVLIANGLITQTQIAVARMRQMTLLANIYRTWWAQQGGRDVL